MLKVIIPFKSEPKYYRKEMSGIKNNTVRTIEMKDSRFKILRHIKTSRKLDAEYWIKIINTKTNKYFLRKITDVTEFKKLDIITWDKYTRCLI